MVSSLCFRPTMACLRKATVTIPKLSPTHTRAKIMKFCIPVGLGSDEKKGGGPPEGVGSVEVVSGILPRAIECYDPLFVLECSPDVVTKGYREQTEDGHDIHPVMIIESHEEGNFHLADDDHDHDVKNSKLKLNEWYDVGHIIGVIDDDDDDDDVENNNEWLWQAYSHSDDDDDNGEVKFFIDVDGSTKRIPTN
mmetsp:Transcript_40525/g.41099  ORF Transcript_40525/g.41099 Transcript_40525/m.41099 type:complete len:194 (-) Transcript_40525:178-759(-)